MPEFIATSAFSGVDHAFPVQLGLCSLSIATSEFMTSVTVYDGAEKDLSLAFKTAHGFAFPGPNRATGSVTSRALWFGRGQVMLIGPVADPSLAAYAALSDQSDAWATVELTGAHSDAVLSRLMPLDFRAMKRGHAARSLLQHMPASVARIGPKTFQIMVYRSMAKTLVHDVHRAMQSVAAQIENDVV